MRTKQKIKNAILILMAWVSVVAMIMCALTFESDDTRLLARSLTVFGISAAYAFVFIYANTQDEVAPVQQKGATDGKERQITQANL